MPGEAVSDLKFEAYVNEWNSSGDGDEEECNPVCAFVQQYTNRATVRANEKLDPVSYNNSFEAFFPPADVKVIKHATVPEDMRVGAEIVYRFAIINTGGLALTNIRVHDSLLIIPQDYVSGDTVLLPGSGILTDPVGYTVTTDDVRREFVENEVTVTASRPGYGWKCAEEDSIGGNYSQTSSNAGEFVEVCATDTHRVVTLSTPIERFPLSVVKSLVSSCLQQPLGTVVDHLVPGAGPGFIVYQVELINNTEVETFFDVCVEDVIQWVPDQGIEISAGDSYADDYPHASETGGRFPKEWLRLRHPRVEEDGDYDDKEFQWNEDTGTFEWKVSSLPPGYSSQLTLKFETFGVTEGQIALENPPSSVIYEFGDESAGYAEGWTENGPSGSAPSSRWQLTDETNTTVVPDGHAWYFGNVGTRTYTDNALGRLDSPPIDAQAVQGVMTMTFRHHLKSETNYDRARVLASSNGSDFQLLTSSSSFDPIPVGAIPLPNNTENWVNITLDLSDFAGTTVTIRFEFESDYSITREGWYIDRVQVLFGQSTASVESQLMFTMPPEIPKSRLCNTARVTSLDGKSIEPEEGKQQLSDGPVYVDIVPKPGMRIVKTPVCLEHPVYYENGKAYFKIELFNDGPSAGSDIVINEIFDGDKLLTLARFAEGITIPPTNPGQITISELTTDEMQTDYTRSGTGGSSWYVSDERKADGGQPGTDAFYFGVSPNARTYTIESSGSLLFNTPIDLNVVTNPSVKFNYFLNQEFNFDNAFVHVLVVDEMGNTVSTNLIARSRKTSDGNSVSQNPVLLEKAGSVTEDWRQVEISLNEFTNDRIKLRFDFVSDFSITAEGWYVNGISVCGTENRLCSIQPDATDFDFDRLLWTPQGGPLMPLVDPVRTRYVEFDVKENLTGGDLCCTNSVSVYSKCLDEPCAMSCAAVDIRPVGKASIVKVLEFPEINEGKPKEIYAGSLVTVPLETATGDPETANLAFRVTVENTGNITLTNVLVSDTPDVPNVENIKTAPKPPEGVVMRAVKLVNDDINLTSAGVSHSFLNGVWTIETIAPGQIATMIVYFNVGPNAPDDFDFVNHATLYGADQEILPPIPKKSQETVRIVRMSSYIVEKKLIPPLVLKDQSSPESDNFPLVSGATVVRLNPSPDPDDPLLELFPEGIPQYVKIQNKDSVFTNLNQGSNLGISDPEPGFEIPDTEFYFDGNLVYELVITNEGPSNASGFLLLDSLINVSAEQLYEEETLGNVVLPGNEGSWTWLDDRHFVEQHAPPPTDQEEALEVDHVAEDAYNVPQAGGVTFHKLETRIASGISAGPLRTPLYDCPLVPNSFDTPAGGYWLVDREIRPNESERATISFTVPPQIPDDVNLINTYVLLDKNADEAKIVQIGDSDVVNVRSQPDFAVNVEPILNDNGPTQFNNLRSSFIVNDAQRDPWQNTIQDALTWVVSITSNGPSAFLGRRGVLIDFVVDEQPAFDHCNPTEVDPYFEPVHPTDGVWNDERLYGDQSGIVGDFQILMQDEVTCSYTNQNATGNETSIHVRTVRNPCDVTITPETLTAFDIVQNPETPGVKTAVLPGASPAFAKTTATARQNVAAVISSNPSDPSFEPFKNGIYWEVENLGVEDVASIVVTLRAPTNLSNTTPTRVRPPRLRARLTGGLNSRLNIGLLDLPVISKSADRNNGRNPTNSAFVSKRPASSKNNGELVSRLGEIQSGGHTNSETLENKNFSACISKKIIHGPHLNPNHPIYQCGDTIYFEIALENTGKTFIEGKQQSASALQFSQ